MITVNWHVWLICALIFFVIELNTPVLVSIWFSIGALCTSFLAVFIHGLREQFIAFVVVSAILLIVSKYFFGSKIDQDNKDEVLEKFLNKRAKVCEDIQSNYEPGKILINGVTWKAVSLTGEKISKDSVVVVKKIEGLTLGVTLLKEKED